MYLTIWIFLTAMILNSNNPENKEIHFGLFADCQYCDCNASGTRFYRNSLQKLGEAIDTFNKVKSLRFIAGLGDLIDRDMGSYGQLNPVLGKSAKKIVHVTGNHDFGVNPGELRKVPEKLGLKNTYHDRTIGDWCFIFLDGNEVTLNSENPGIVATAKELLGKLKSENKPNAYEWNGAISETQVKWLEDKLVKAEKKNKKVIIFCHYPLLPFEAHALWNSDRVIGILEKHKCVKAYFNGHNHAGNYVMKNGIHYITFRGMVETENKNAFALVTLKSSQIIIRGSGREQSRTLITR